MQTGFYRPGWNTWVSVPYSQVGSVARCNRWTPRSQPCLGDGAAMAKRSSLSKSTFLGALQEQGSGGPVFKEHFFAAWRCLGTPCPLVMLQHITAFISASCSLHSPQACLENLSSLRSQPTAAVRGGGKEEEQVRSTKPEDVPFLASSWGTFPQLRGPGHTIWLIDRRATVLPRQGLQ